VAIQEALTATDDRNIVPKNRGEKTARYCRFENPVNPCFSKKPE
jgi:hypothetical protein